MTSGQIILLQYHELTTSLSYLSVVFKGHKASASEWVGGVI